MYGQSRSSGYHPHYIFGKRGKKYYSLGLTTHPKKKMKVIKINSPNPSYNGDQYIQLKLFKMPKGAYDHKVRVNWKFHSSDLPLIRHLKKKYRKK